ncbi:MAG: GTP-binding protein Obg/CgtA [Cyanobacteria bacterium RYN_339]|nr:GTP-binding protein Obg/CgtA [Cyanobacteria bacterium RYN_339]
MFIDRAKIFVKSGDGGNGVVMWRREKFVAAGGPAGGDGGGGGSVVIVATNDLNTLLDFRFNRRFIAQPGDHGGPKNMHGKTSPDLEIRVPVGTVIKDTASGTVLADLHEDGQRFVAAKGGRGGRGNSHFATPTRKAPDFAEPGKPGEEHEVDLELKLLADVGLVGLPNAGKSTLISTVAAARPKIADYPFTTLEPNLGVIQFGPGETLVMADIPGLVEGAAEGIGLGHDFLRHVERCRVLVHLLDLSGGLEGRDPLEDFRVINQELARYSPELAARPMLVVLNKIDLPDAQANRERVEAALAPKDYEVFAISAATREGIDPFLSILRQRVSEQPPPQIFTPQPRPQPEVPKDPLTIAKENGVWQVRHAGLQTQLERLNLDTPDAVVRLHKLLDDLGVIVRLREMGVADGDGVAIGDFEFDFVD